MKKHLYTLIAWVAIVCCAAGCTREAYEAEVEAVRNGGSTLLEATLESESDTRTVMSELTGGIYKNLWATEDKIGVFIDGEANASIFELTSGEGETTATFKGYGEGASYVALYPYAMAEGLEGNNLSVSLPAEQTYAENSFGPNSFPMLAVSSSTQLKFKNLCAVLKVSITGHHNVKSIVFKANDANTYVSGKAKVDISHATTPALTMQQGGSNEVTLICNGAQLRQDEETNFHIVVPAQTYKGGFTLTVNTSTGWMEKKVTEDVVMERSGLRKLKTFACRLDEGVEPSATLEGKGTEEEPFLIKSLGDLLLMQGAVNSADGKIIPADGSGEQFADNAHYKLTQDISLAEVCGAQKGDWTSIGNYSEKELNTFWGTFDGDGHTISDLYINNQLERQGLFGLVDFGGVVKNLTVKGNIKCLNYAGLICGYSECTIEDCEVQGSVEVGGQCVAGIAGSAGGGSRIERCMNHAEIVGNGNFAGGIAGDASGRIIGCVNAGPVSGIGYWTAGITGYQNAGALYNCSNSGKVAGYVYAGGITGYTRQGSRLYNCVNAGDVSGEEYVGGITAYCMYDASWPKTRGDDHSEVMNCLNVGKVEAHMSATRVGSIAGLNDALVSNCYWLYDEEARLGMENGIGYNYADVANNFGLTDAQMKGSAYFTALYTATDATPYYKVLDALNAWANDHKTDEMELWSWKQGDTNSYPTLDSKVATKPVDDSNPVFELSAKEFYLTSKGGTISVNVVANMSYYLSSMPDWITETTADTKSITEKQHNFLVQENPSSEARSGVIVFCNESQQCIPVSVTQNGKVSEDMAWTEKEFWHKSLAMRFTADWCGYCPRLATVFADAQTQYPGRLEVVHMHCDGGQAFDKATALMTQYQITGFPTGIVDGRIDVNSVSEIGNAMEATEKKYGTETGISFESHVQGDQLSVLVNLYLKKADNYKVTVLLLESGIVGWQADYYSEAGEHYDYVHNDVPRLALTHVTGDSFSTTEGNQVKEFSYTGTIPTKCNKENLRVLVYVQRAYGTRQKIASGDYGDYYVDNSLSEKTGANAELKFVEE